MLYFICWAAFLGIIILATIIAAVMDKSGGKKSSAAATETDSGGVEFDEAEVDEAVPDDAMDMQEIPADSVEAFGEPAGDDFAEFENEFK